MSEQSAVPEPETVPEVWTLSTFNTHVDLDAQLGTAASLVLLMGP